MAIEKTLLFQGKKIFYRVVGQGPITVLLHGVPFDGNLWTPLLTWTKGENNEHVSFFENPTSLGKFKFIIPDLPGSGESETIQDMSMEGLADVVKEIINAECSKVPGIEKVAINIAKQHAILIGHSMGGYISLAFAQKYPDDLRGLGLFHSTAYADNEERRLKRRNAIESIKDNGASEFLRTIIPSLFSPQWRETNRASIDQFIARTNNFSADALVSYYEAMMMRPDRTATLKNLKIPILFIAGKFDTAAPLNDLLKQCHLPEISYFHILEDVGHMGMVEEAQKTNNILNEYLLNVS